MIACLWCSPGDSWLSGLWEHFASSCPASRPPAASSPSQQGCSWLLHCDWSRVLQIICVRSRKPTSVSVQQFTHYRISENKLECNLKFGEAFQWLSSALKRGVTSFLALHLYSCVQAKHLFSTAEIASRLSGFLSALPLLVYTSLTK